MLAWGLSPRVRGNRADHGDRPRRIGSIPACAGEPSTSPSGRRATGVYPRVCGGTIANVADIASLPGLSPRVRGNRLRVEPELAAGGSIPACAGEPRPSLRSNVVVRVYPRVCGGTPPRAPGGCGRRGLSPRVRGNPVDRRPVPLPAGSIPACAGEPWMFTPPPPGGRVYPRVCGGTAAWQRRHSTRKGLSPRVRGNLAAYRVPVVAEGSIPACAGEPRRRRVRRGGAGVYPRVCGGTARLTICWSVCAGLSPRVRGNRLRHAVVAAMPGSIPACAGEPARFRASVGKGPVYPRVCGGTLRVDRAHRRGEGLSPRVRGNREIGKLATQYLGSIPACAGEPWPPRRKPCETKVYPRVCGGTSVGRRPVGDEKGLSPRVRGNRTRGGGAPPPAGSIPACAGEPHVARSTTSTARVYPRVCGGTSGCPSRASAAPGLSPRVRGNQLGVKRKVRVSGSIPACAGEPTSACPRRTLARVYPRVCGGTSVSQFGRRIVRGLSPRVRGNRSRHGRRPLRPLHQGSIPACAGEPNSRAAPHA